MSPEASMSTCGPPAPPAGPVGTNWTADVWLESFANWLTKAWGTSPSCHHTAAASPRPSTATRGQEAPVAIGVPIGSGLDQPVVIFHHVARRSLSAEGLVIDKTTASHICVL